MEDFSFHSGPLQSLVSADPVIVDIVRPNSTWSRARSGQNKVWMKWFHIHFQQGQFLTIPGISGLLVKRLPIILEIHSKQSGLLWMSELLQCRTISSHILILPACVIMAWSKMSGVIRVSNSGGDASLLFSWLPFEGLVRGWKHFLVCC